MDQLEDRLTDNYLKKETQAKVESVRKVLEERRKQFIKANILYKIITDISNDSSCPVKEEIAHCLTMAEIKGSLNLGQLEGSEITTLGLTEEDIPSPKLEPHVAKVLYQSIEERLYEETKSLYQIVHCDQPQELSRSLLHPHLIRLHEKIADIDDNVEEMRREMKILNGTFTQTLSKHMSVLAAIEDKLREIVDKHYTGSKLDYTSVHIQYLRAKVDTVHLKCKKVETEIKLATYSKEALKAIKIVSENLKERIRVKESELTSLQNTILQ